MAGFLQLLGFGSLATPPLPDNLWKPGELRDLGSIEFERSWGDYEVNQTTAGENVNAQTALLSSAFYRCITIIAGTVALLPRQIKMYDERGDIEAKNHPNYFLFKTEPSPFMTWYNLMFIWVATAIARGNGYIKIHRNGVGRPVRLQFLEHSECQVYYQKTLGVETLWYFVHGEPTPPRDILHLNCLGSNGVVGQGIAELARESLGLGMAAGRTMAKFYKTGMRSKAVFSTPEMLDDDSFDHLKSQIKSNMQDDFFLLEGGAAATSLQLSPADVEVLATRKFQVEDVARFMGVPLSKLNVSDKTSVGNSLAEQNVDFETDCILPWTEQIEQELNRKLLIPSERLTHYYSLDERYVRRMDSAKRSEYFKNRWLTGSMTSNQIRVLEGERMMDNELMNITFAQSGTIPMDTKYWEGKHTDNTLKNDNSGEQSGGGSSNTD